MPPSPDPRPAPDAPGGVQATMDAVIEGVGEKAVYGGRVDVLFLDPVRGRPGYAVAFDFATGDTGKPLPHEAGPALTCAIGMALLRSVRYDGRFRVSFADLKRDDGEPFAVEGEVHEIAGFPSPSLN